MSKKNWVKIFFLVVLFFGLFPYVLSYLWLTSIYENNSYKEIVSRQLRNSSIYGTALNQNTFKYKLQLIKKIKPSVIALGSSRVMQFRKESFNVPFVNAGGAMNYLTEGLLFMDKMLSFHKPKYIILGVDFWWFNDDFYQPTIFPSHLNDGKTMDLNKIIKPYIYLINRKIDTSSLRYIISNNKITNSYTSYDSLGLSAIKTSNGFRKDGSYFYSKTIFGIEKSDDMLFKNTFKRIINGNDRFEYGEHISDSRLILFNLLIDKIIKNNIKLIIIIPPVANSVHAKMYAQGKYKYVNELIRYVSKLKLPTFNYHDVSTISNDDCEFIDGFHGGDVIYQRILLDIFNSKKDLYFNSNLNINLIRDNINKFKGKVLSINKGDQFNLDEMDFLGIGCNKL